MTDLFSVLSIGSIIIHQVAHSYSGNTETKKFHGRTTKIEWARNPSSKGFIFFEKLGLGGSYRSNSLKFHPVKRKNYKSPK